MEQNKIQKWKELSRELVFNTYTQIEKVEYLLPTGAVKDFYIKKTKPAAGVLALTEKNDVILVRQFRPGPNEILLELPGGYVDGQESPTDAALRELLEETGYAGDAQFVTNVLDDAYTTMRRACVIATNCKKVAEQKLDDSEFAQVVLLPLDDFRKLLRSGQMTDVEIAYLGLDFLGLL